MLQSLFINVSMVISTLFVFFQLYFRFVARMKWSVLHQIILGCAFGLAQVIFFKFPIYIDHTTVTLGKSMFITSALFGGIYAAVATLLIFHGLFSLLPHGGLPHNIGDVPPMPGADIGPQHIHPDALPPMAPMDGQLMSYPVFIPMIDLIMLVVCVFCLRLQWGRFQKWFLLNAIFQLVFILEGKVHSSSMMAMGLEFMGSLFIYFFVNYMYRSNEDKCQLEANSLTDALTGLYNLRFFKSTYEKLFRNARLQHHEFSLLMVDIDHFKRINDTYGHPVGDIVLRELAQILKSTCEGMEIVSRTGGEEFCVILPKSSRADALRLAERIRIRVEGHDFIIRNGEEPLRVTVSIGLSELQERDHSAEQFLSRTDEALYRAKENGRNQVCY